MFEPCFAMHYLVSILVFAITLQRERERERERERDSLLSHCVTLTVFLVSCDCKCYVALPHCVLSLSAVDACGKTAHTPKHFHSIR